MRTITDHNRENTYENDNSETEELKCIMGNIQTGLDYKKSANILFKEKKFQEAREDYQMVIFYLFKY
jgi:tetratricopeptide (TPR) repeat protein